MKKYLYQIGVIQNGESITTVKQRYEVTGSIHDIREDARALLDKLDSGIILYKWGDYLEQFGEYDRDVDSLIDEIDQREEQNKGKGDSYII